MSEVNSFGHGEFIERIAAYLSDGLEGGLLATVAAATSCVAATRM